ncbi:MAG: 30S ribosomal protein S8 [Microgenomates group bacterium GW2011_GWA1_Microgenomates_45_10]|nr:MAG: 30S ribosomal protein S8 [Microgenomates group bacterium GW2011_GWA2_44_7]KKT78082.1 MAG: 30S ribosomal protein S8 [Microgenomates group bacterium GW2011_GWB1_44_8]KKT87419.1 MAG: 30S ribosomal protein S8 [Microgenomates group bacterium GW2011_GWA1_Microgenomates_45_10]
MSVNDHLSDLLSRITNATLRRKEEVTAPFTKLTMAVGEVLVREKYIQSVDQKNDGKSRKLVLRLRYVDGNPSITGLGRVSKPGVRIYVRSGRIPLVLGGKGLVIISTSKGVMSGSQARKKRLGGEVICKVW